MTPPKRSAALRIGLSARALAAHGPAIAQALAGRRHQLLSFEALQHQPLPALDIALISRDVTGLSTKQVVATETAAVYDLLRRAPALAWVHIHSAGADRPIYQALMARGVAVSTSSGANAEVVVQTAVAGLLALARGFPALMAAQQQRHWLPLMASALPRELSGQTALIVGWGPIGQGIGAVLRLLGLKLRVVRHSGAPVAADVPSYAFSDWRQALPRADWLLLACPLNAASLRLVDAAALALLPAGARLINVARGEVVVESDLVAALQSGRLGGAYLDVFEHEPLPADSPLWTLDGVLLTPHVAGFSDGNEARVVERFVANLQRWTSGQDLASLASLATAAA